MDKHELIKTVLTIVLTVFAKECLGWLVSWIKKIVAGKTIKEIILALIVRNRDVIAILFDVSALCVGLHVLFVHAKENHAINQWEVVFICLYTVNVLFWIVSLFRDCVKAVAEWIIRKDRKQIAGRNSVS